MTSSLTAPPAPPKRLAHKRNTDWSTEDDPRNSSDSHDLRDSGISTLSSLSDLQSHLSNLNNLSYEDFEPRSRCNDIMNISPPSVISAMSISTLSFSSVTFQNSHGLMGQEVKIIFILYIVQVDILYANSEIILSGKSTADTTESPSRHSIRTVDTGTRVQSKSSRPSEQRSQ